ncbi:MAG: endolytic transglycosylase MltG [SAR324 cluster bacterium]|uniref:Endolytic murein transglycosylase n=1 Tax=SAR324 cluster bacterium TaxID=2024889 RepID=A0A7X9FPK3_9DELT|nr:endolytic transglycosylase MltG [SAR324 cluster bacterium]
MKHLKLIITAVALAIVLGLAFIATGAPARQADTNVFTISKTKQQQTTERLVEGGYIKSSWVLPIARLMTLRLGTIEPGGYKISQSMNARELIIALTSEPQLKWITFPEGLRKEEIGERLAKQLHWTDEELEKWNTTYTAMQYDYREGVYFPDTYLIPLDENELDTAQRMINSFNEKFQGYPEKFAAKDIKWTTALTLASIIQREAAGAHDMPLIAGILWNRLNQNKQLEIDATVQYARGKTDNGWWSPIKGSETRSLESPFNTYLNKGLPPHPISNPGMDAIDAVLSPEETDCIYYLHDSDGVIHCSASFAEHELNIDRYLR